MLLNPSKQHGNDVSCASSVECSSIYSWDTEWYYHFFKTTSTCCLESKTGENTGYGAPVLQCHEMQYYDSKGSLIYGWFQELWYPQIIQFNKVFHYKPSILGYHYFWKHPYAKLHGNENKHIHTLS